MFSSVNVIPMALLHQISLYKFINVTFPANADQFIKCNLNPLKYLEMILKSHLEQVYHISFSESLVPFPTGNYYLYGFTNILWKEIIPNLIIISFFIVLSIILSLIKTIKKHTFTETKFSKDFYYAFS